MENWLMHLFRSLMRMSSGQMRVQGQADLVAGLRTLGGKFHSRKTIPMA